MVIEPKLILSDQFWGNKKRPQLAAFWSAELDCGDDTGPLHLVSIPKARSIALGFRLSFDFEEGL
jgi:hypothetical protein